MADDVIRVPERDRFQLRRGDEVIGTAYYREADGVVTFTHTEVDQSLQERGLGSTLVRRALEQVREAGERMTPECPFVAAYVERHPEFGDLVA